MSGQCQVEDYALTEVVGDVLLAASQHACAVSVLHLPSRRMMACDAQRVPLRVRCVVLHLESLPCCQARRLRGHVRQRRSFLQALKDAGCDEVVLAINYQPKASPSLPPAAQILRLCAAGPFTWRSHVTDALNITTFETHAVP